MDATKTEALRQALIKTIDNYGVAGSKDFYKIAVDTILTHANKNEDYASQNRFSGFDNFIESAGMVGTSVRQVFRVMQAIKLSRYNSLLASKAKPNNESFRDTVHDMAVYYMLEAAFEDKFGDLINQKLTNIPADINGTNIREYFGVVEG